MGGLIPAVLHGLMRADDAAALAALPDMFGEGEVRAVPAGHLRAIVSLCPGSIDVAALFADAERVQPLAVAHNRILSQAAERHDVLPVRLGAVFGSQEALSEKLGTETDALLARLDAIAGGVEYGLKITLNNTPQPQAQPSAATGRDYLRQRGAQRTAALDIALDAVTRANGIVAALADLAMDSRKRPTAPGGQPVHAFAFLVSRAARDAFEEKAGILAQSVGGGLSLQVSGPWPVYSFAGEA